MNECVTDVIVLKKICIDAKGTWILFDLKYLKKLIKFVKNLGNKILQFKKNYHPLPPRMKSYLKCCDVKLKFNSVVQLHEI